MTLDRYAKIVLTVIAVALVIIAARPWLPESFSPDTFRTTPALAQTSAPKYGELVVPKAWGKYIAYSNNNLLLEAPDKSLRVVDLDGKAPEYPRLKVIVHWGQ
ncbi:MAG: hypothetical protein DME04_18570 [Candidatus Rokuibacteriota bacterium]|nr:MAG: hypothetical protein DME04_18570 [Candidatus Rokubacteria bacterium]